MTTHPRLCIDCRQPTNRVAQALRCWRCYDLQRTREDSQGRGVRKRRAKGKA